MINHGENSETRIHVLQDSKEGGTRSPGALTAGAALPPDISSHGSALPYLGRNASLRCDRLLYEAAVADLMLAIRSSIRSRSTSQYLSADSSSLSG